MEFKTLLFFLCFALIQKFASAALGIAQGQSGKPYTQSAVAVS